MYHIETTISQMFLHLKTCGPKKAWLDNKDFDNTSLPWIHQLQTWICHYDDKSQSQVDAAL